MSISWLSNPHAHGKSIHKEPAASGAQGIMGFRRWLSGRKMWQPLTPRSSEDAVQAWEFTVPTSSRLPATPPKRLLVRAEVSEKGSQVQPWKRIPRKSSRKQQPSLGHRANQGATQIQAKTEHDDIHRPRLLLPWSIGFGLIPVY